MVEDMLVGQEDCGGGTRKSENKQITKATVRYQPIGKGKMDVFLERDEKICS
jgi:hypothetical protein